eukprot:scaffold82878_cov60-Phaeocystis_antarctica.AAC.1
MLGGSDPPPRCVNVLRVAPPPGGKGPKTLAPEIGRPPGARISCIGEDTDAEAVERPSSSSGLFSALWLGVTCGSLQERPGLRLFERDEENSTEAQAGLRGSSTGIHRMHIKRWHRLRDGAPAPWQSDTNAYKQRFWCHDRPRSEINGGFGYARGIFHEETMSVIIVLLVKRSRKYTL